MHLSLLWKFIDDHSTANPELNGTYRIFGAVSDEYPFSGVPRKRTTICRQGFACFPPHYLLFNNGIKKSEPF